MSPRKASKPILDAARADRVERFFERHLRHMKGRWAGQPFTLEDWQKEEIIRPIFGTVDAATGKRWYREALIGLARKQGKSEIAAGIALYMLVADGEFGAEVYSLAGDRKQASLVFRTAAEMVKASPLLRSACKVYRSVIEVGETGAIYRALSADADLQHGLNPSCAIIDEYHIHRNSEQYEAMRTGTAARDQSLIVTITTAGEDRRGACWDLYQRAQSGTDPRLYHYWRSVPDGTALSDLKAFKDQANPASWVTLDFLKDQARSLPEPVFRRLHGNQWWSGATEGWISSETWDACAGVPEIDPSLPACIGIDAASKRDTTAVALVQRNEAGQFHCRVWHFAADEEGGYLDYGAVEDLVRELAATYDIRRVAADPFQMVRSMQMLANEGIPTEVFPQTDTRMVPASTLIYDAIMEGRLVHDGSAELSEQVLAAKIIETARGWRLTKKRSDRPIDAAIALTIAIQLAEFEADTGGAPRVTII